MVKSTHIEATGRSAKKAASAGRVSRAKYNDLLQASLKQQAVINQMTSENEKMSNALVKSQEESRALKIEVSRLQSRISAADSLLTTYHKSGKGMEILINSYRAVVIDMSQATELEPVEE